MATGNRKNVVPNHDYASEHPELEAGFDIPVAGIPGNAADMAAMLGRDGKWLCGGDLPCYATGRTDRKAPPHPGVTGNLRGAR